MRPRAFDTPLLLQHASDVLTFGRYATAIVLALAVATANGAVCAGWAPTAEARMACCADDACPMHKGSEQSTHDHGVTQAQADACCEASERDDTAQSSSPFAFTVSLGIVPTPVRFALPEPLNAPHAGQTLVPIPLSNVPKHLLLSVLLV